MKNKKDWVVCQLENFNGDVSDFSRDAGLFCRAFNELGYDTKLILKSPSKKGELKQYVLRATEAELCSVDWWKNIEAQNVFLYPQYYTKNVHIVEAMKKARKRIVVYMDAGSEIYPFYSWWFNTKLIFRKNKINGARFYVIKSFLEIIKMHFSIFNFNRYNFFKFVDLVVFSSPLSAKHHLSIPFYLPREIKKKAIVSGCPIDWTFLYDGIKKENIALAIGRWDDEESKRSRYLMEAIECSFNKTDIVFHVFGNTPSYMYEWYSNLPQENQSRVLLHGKVTVDELKKYYVKSKIVLCPSIHEGTHLASAEGLCFGCSVVVPPCPTLSCVHWYTSKYSGTISQYDTPESFAEAVTSELSMWETDKRNPFAISQQWQEEFCATQTVKKVLNCMSRMY